MKVDVHTKNDTMKNKRTGVILDRSPNCDFNTGHDTWGQ